jgi:flavin reductase
MNSHFRCPAAAPVTKPRTSSTAVSANIAADSALYKQGMRRLASGVSVIATEHRGERSGLLSTGVASVSADPPVLLACINRSASSHGPIGHSGRFCVNVLQQNDEELAGRFSSSSYREGRFLGREWISLATGAPALVGCLASFDCVVTRALTAETHTVFFGNVVEVRLWSEAIEPLLYWDGSYRGSQPSGETVAVTSSA